MLTEERARVFEKAGGYVRVRVGRILIPQSI